MTRRSLLALLPACMVARFVDAVPTMPATDGELIDIPTWSRKYGTRRPPERRGRVYRMYLDGVDITCDAFLAHTGEGWAECYVRPPADPENPHAFRVVRGPNNKPLTERRHGKVEIR